MAAKEVITTTINRLRNTMTKGVPIIVETKLNSIESLIKTLEKQNAVIIQKYFTNSCVVKLTPEVLTIEALPKFVHIKRKNISEQATKMLGDNEGFLIISTPKGIMAHQRALNKNLGGIILGLVTYRK